MGKGPVNRPQFWGRFFYVAIFLKIDIFGQMIVLILAVHFALMHTFTTVVLGLARIMVITPYVCRAYHSERV